VGRRLLYFDSVLGRLEKDPVYVQGPAQRPADDRKARTPERKGSLKVPLIGATNVQVVRKLTTEVVRIPAVVEA
jgi:hypothetical protein